MGGSNAVCGQCFGAPWRCCRCNRRAVSSRTVERPRLQVASFKILIAGGAGIFQELPVLRSERYNPSRNRPWLGIEFRIIDRVLIRELVRADSAPSFGYMQGVAVPVTMTVEPRLITILEANRIDDQRIAFPLAYRVAKLRSFPILAMSPPVRINNAEVMHVLIQENDLIRQLDDLQRIGLAVQSRYARKEAIAHWFDQVGHIVERFQALGRERQRLQTSGRVRNDSFVPDSRQVRPAIRGAGNWRSVRLRLVHQNRRSLTLRILTENN